jgi:hypothetical protein
VLGARDPDGDRGPSPASIGTTSVPLATMPARVVGAGLEGRMALLPTSPSDVNANVAPAALTWANRTRADRLLARPDGSAWARVDLDAGTSTWDAAAAKVGSGVERIELAGAPALRFQEHTTWVVMWPQDDGTATLRSGGLDMAAVESLGAALAAGAVPDGWQAAEPALAWNTYSAIDQFGIAVRVRSAELPRDLDLLLGAIDDAAAGTTLQATDVEGGPGWFTQPVGTSRLDMPQLVWARDGLLVALSRQDATLDELRGLASTVTVQALNDLTVPVGTLQSNAPTATVLLRDVAVLEQHETPQGRYQWLAFRSRPQPGTAGTDGWCVSYVDSQFPGGWPGTCGPAQGEFSGTAEIVAGTALGVVDGDVSGAWFVVNGVRVDAELTPFGDLNVLRASVPLGDRVSLHLVRGGDEVAGTVGLDATTRCVGCPPPVIAPPGWVMPTLTSGGVVVPDTATPGP